MYYFLLTITIILIYIIHNKYQPLRYLSNLYNKIKTERFEDKINSPNPSSSLNNSLPSQTDNILTPNSSPAFLDYNSMVKDLQKPVQVLSKLEDLNLGINLSLDLMYLEPDYNFEEDLSIIGKKNKTDTFEWKTKFEEVICHSDKGACGCLEVEDGENICGIEDNGVIYECASPCPECNNCHLRKSKVAINYSDFCHTTHTEDEKEKCNKYKERLLFTKEKCITSGNSDSRIVSQRDKCNIFQKENFNSYLVGDDIIFKLDIEYINLSLKDEIEAFEIVEFSVDKIPTKINIFFQNKNEIFFFLPAKNSFIGTNKIVEIVGNIIFKENSKPKTEFKSKNIINVFSVTEEDVEFKKPREEIFKEKISKNINPNRKRIVKSADDDKYAEHYLGKNRYFMCQIQNNYSVYNKIKDLDNGIYEEKKLIDNPSSWKNRTDINRPWDYIIK